MFIDRLVNTGNINRLEQLVSFTAQRHEMIANNIVNIDTPGFRQKDLDENAFYKRMRKQGANSSSGKPFDAIQTQPNILFHDGNNRSIEGLMSDLSRNALTHNLAIEMLRSQFDSIETALKERVA